MDKELRELRKRLNSLKPFGAELRRSFELLSSLDIFYTELKLGGSGLSREEAAGLLNGETVLKASIEEHMRARRVAEIKTLMRARADMDHSPDIKLLEDIYEAANGEKAEYRKAADMHEKLRFISCYPDEIAPELKRLFKEAEAARRAEGFDETAEAVQLMLGLIVTRPFRSGNDEAARLMLEYYLLREGYPLFALNFSPEEFEGALRRYIEDGDAGQMLSGVKRSLFNRLSSMIQMAEGENA